MFNLYNIKKRGLSFEELAKKFVKPNPKNLLYNLDRVLSGFTDADPFTLNEATQGVQIFGATGSGKTSGSGKFLADSYLSAGFGGLVLTVKRDEREMWEKYCLEMGRELKIFSPEEPWRFNFLEYEMNRGGRGGGETENIIDLFMEVLELTSAGKGNNIEKFWDIALQQLLRNTIDLIKFADERLTMENLYKIISSAPQKKEDIKVLFSEDGGAIKTEWMEKSFCAKLIFQAFNRPELSERDKSDLQSVLDYWRNDFAGLNDKTRSIITFSFTGFADVFLRGTLKELFCTTTNIFPELTHEGIIILIDLPVHEYNRVGQSAQAIFKYLWQKATERRKKVEDMRPVFLWVDEAQYFLTKNDVKFASTSRSSRACTVYLTQNLPNYTGIVGEELTYSMLGNLQTKVFHQNSDPKTNQYASKIIGKVWQDHINTSVSRDSTRDQEGSKGSTSFGEEVQYDILPVEFTTLAKGGVENGLIVEGIVYQGGRVWQANGKRYLRTSFLQS